MCLWISYRKLDLTKAITPHANSDSLLKRSSSHSHSVTILLVVWSTNGDGSAPTSKASSKVNLLNDDTYLPMGWCDHRYMTVIVSSFGQIEEGAH